MDLRQLAALVALADTGSFSAAARSLHTVQSNVSTHVARLEKELGVQLFDRALGSLTAEGLTVVERSRRVQAELESLQADLAALRDQLAGTVRLGVIGTTARWLVPAVIEATGRRFPSVRVVFVDATTTSLLPQVVHGSLDLAVVNLPVDDPDVETEPLFLEERLAVAPNDHPLAGRGEVELAELCSYELLLEPAGTSFRAELDQAVADAGLELQVKAEIDGMRLLASLAFAGYGAAVLPASAVPGEAGRDWTRVRVRGLRPRSVGLARRRRGLPSAPARAIRELVRDVVATEATKQPGLHHVAVQ